MQVYKSVDIGLPVAVLFLDAQKRETNEQNLLCVGFDGNARRVCWLRHSRRAQSRKSEIDN